MLRILLLVFLSCLWLSCGAFAHASSAAATTTNDKTPIYRVRRREGAATVEEIQQKRRDLAELLPSFSKEDELLVEAEMPRLTLLLRGLGGESLGNKSYDALQTAMNDYLQKRLEDYFEPRYEFIDVRSEVVVDVPFEGDGDDFPGGNAVTVQTYLTFNDPNYAPPPEEPRQRTYFAPTFRASDAVEEAPQPRTAVSEGVPSELELEFAAGHAWNDLSSFRNHLLVAAAIENLSTFDGIGAIDSLEQFPTSAQTADEIAVVEDEEGNEDLPDAKPEVRPPKRVEIIPPPGNSLNVAAASSALKESGNDRLNPLWPALIVGIAVFLLTVIVLGYRKHKARRNDPFSGGRKDGKKENVMIHIINDNSTLEGDEEIEVEDTLYSTPNNSPDRNKRKTERDLDKEYATSCLKPVALGRSASSPSVVSDDNEDENNHDGDGTGRKNCFQKKRSIASDEDENNHDGDGIGRKNCFKKSSKRVSLQDQDSMAFDTNSNRGVELPRRVDLTAAPDQSSWRNPAKLQEEEGDYDNGDMTKTERKRFTKYIESGLTIEEASHQIMNERKAKSRTRSIRGQEGPSPPSVMSGTRSGDVAGYSNPSNRRSIHRGRPKIKSDQSNPMGCCAEDTLHSELMEDGTAVHYVHKPSFMSLGDACSANDPSLLNGIQDGKEKVNARAMVITAASSYASSYDDDEFERAMEDAVEV